VGFEKRGPVDKPGRLFTDRDQSGGGKNVGEKSPVKSRGRERGEKKIRLRGIRPEERNFNQLHYNPLDASPGHLGTNRERIKKSKGDEVKGGERAEKRVGTESYPHSFKGQVTMGRKKVNCKKRKNDHLEFSNLTFLRKGATIKE